MSQLPEAIFQQVNENFYRTTFYELCSRYLSRWLAFTVENSYPQGRSDLEFIGKFHEKFAGKRWVMEFKYFSNAELARMKIPIGAFTLREEDTVQIRGYAEGSGSKLRNAGRTCMSFTASAIRGFGCSRRQNRENNGYGVVRFRYQGRLLFSYIAAFNFSAIQNLIRDCRVTPIFLAA